MTTLLVPIALDVMVVRKAGSAEDWAATAMAAPQVGTGQPERQQLLPDPFTPLAEPRPPGAYLHWALPDALTLGTPRNGRMELPALPERWLVVRLTTPPAPGPRRVDAWLIPDAGADQPTSLAKALSGPPLPTAPGGPRAPITAWGHGDLSWSAYFDNTVDRFALYDDLDGVSGAVAYLVCGWYVDRTRDPIAAASEAAFHDRLLALQWALADALPSGTAYPDRSVYHAAAVAIGWPEPAWPGDGGLLAQELDQWPASAGLGVALGETLAEAIATLASGGNGTPGYAKLLEARLSGVLGDVTSADGIAALETALHVARFGSSPSEPAQEVTWNPSAGADADSGGAFRAVQRSTPRTWLAADPSILVQGGGRNPKHGGDGRYSTRGELACRIDGQTLVAFGVAGGDPGYGAKMLPDPPLAGLRADYGVPAVASALLVELACLDPASAPDLGSAGPREPSPVAAARARWWAAFDPAVPESKALEGASWEGRFPSPVGVTPPTRPWTPIHLEWSADYLPSPRGTRDWTLGEADFELPDSVDRPPADPEHRLAGRTILHAGPAMLLAQASGDPASADADLLGGTLEDIAAQLRGDSRLAVVGSGGASGEPDPRPPGFIPLRAGFLRLDRLRIVDGYGQCVDLIGPSTTAPAPVVMGPGLAAPGEPDLAALRPRFTAAARVLLRFVDADDGLLDVEPGATPVCGYLVPALGDGTLEFFDATGAGWGRLRPDATSGIAWEESPGRERTLGSRPSAVLANRLLGSLADSMIDLDLARPGAAATGRTALATLLKVLDTTRWAADLTGRAGDEYLSLLLGQPIAVVRAALEVEVLDPRRPAENNSTAITVRLGTLSHLQDGLLGYYIGDDLRTLRLVDPAIAGLAAGPGEPPLHPRSIDASGVFHANPGTSVPLCLLMLPGTDLHVTTGLLPRKRVGLQREWTAAALSRLAPSLRFGPILRDAQSTRLPVAAGLRGEWLWHRRPDPTSWATDAVVPSTAAAAAPDGTALANDGWLQFKLAADTPHAGGQIHLEVIGVRRRGAGSRAIDGIEGRNADGSTFLLPASQVMAHIESGRFAFYVGSAGSARVYLRIVRRRNGRRYLRTVADSASPNNLARLPTFEGRRVPAIVGLPLADALAAIRAADLTASNVQHRFDGRPIDEVIVQRPAAGVEVSRGSAVQVIASDGPSATVPGVVGMGLATAGAEIEAARLSVGDVLRRFDPHPLDEVLDQMPLSGTLARRGSRVGLSVSDGPAAVVPNLVGRPLAEATDLLLAARLTMGAIALRVDARPRGEIVAQSPAAGSRVAAGTSVAPTVSDGPRATVPTLVGQPFANAAGALAAAGLVAGAVQRRFDATPLDRIVDQAPAGGSVVQPGTAVAFTVSDGPAAVVPVLVGQPLAAAGDAITAAGLTLGPVVRQISTRPKDEVLAQTLAAGAQVARDSTIGLAVSDGPGTLVPDVIGLTETVAGRTITAAGLQSLVMFRVQGSEPAGTVVGQRPGAGERLAGGGTVGLTVSTGSGGGQLPL
jgi:beta-lactam-binding protein with PASTA domain